MDKKYQIFVSSTYTDLRDARSLILKSILDLHHIPAGMEMFSADDSAQWDTISRMIDLSDYYVLILGLRYGSISHYDNISFTEKEYDYAIANEIPVLSFILNDDVALSKNDRDDDLTNINKFREKVKTNNKMSDFWSTKEELASKVLLALIKQFDLKPRIGWVRANQVASPETLNEIATISKENRELREKLNLLEQKNPIDYEIEFRAKTISFEYLREKIYKNIDNTEKNNSAVIKNNNLKYDYDAYNRAFENYKQNLQDTLQKIETFIEDNSNKYFLGVFYICNTGKKSDEKIEITIKALNNTLYNEKEFIMQTPTIPLVPDINNYIIKEKNPFDDLLQSNFGKSTTLVKVPSMAHTTDTIRYANADAFRRYLEVQPNAITLIMKELHAERTTTVSYDAIVVSCNNNPEFEFEIFSKNSTGRIAKRIKIIIEEDSIQYNKIKLPNNS